MKKNNREVKPSKKPSTFDGYVAARSAQIEKMLQQALRYVDAQKYGNVTDYCKALAAVISDVREAKAGDPTTPFYNKRVRKFSYITLLRNDDYRGMVDAIFDQSREALEQPEMVSEEALLKISSLNAQLNLLKDRLSSIKTGDQSNALVDANAQGTIRKLSLYLSTTLTVYSTMREQFKGVTKIFDVPAKDIPGLWSGYGLIADKETLQEIEDGRKFLNQLPRIDDS